MDDLNDPLGGKRKYKENPLTAKAETGSLRIKLVRKGEGAQSAGLLGANVGGTLDAFGLAGVPRSPSRAPVAAPAQPVPSPPKPRANRKHVPIFYQRPNAFDISASTSTDGTASQQASVTSEYEQSFSGTGSTSTSSTTTRFSRLDIAPGLPGSLQDPMPPMNPLFTRGMSETSGSLTDLLKTVLPSVPPLESTGSFTDYSSEMTSSGSQSLTSSQSSILNPAAALRQLASSSAAYSRDSTGFQSMQQSQRYQILPLHTQSDDHDDYQNGYSDDHLDSHEEHVPTSEPEQQPSYRFDAMSALQNAVKIAVQSNSPTNTQLTLGRSIPESDDNDLGPPPSAPPGFSIQHSLMGGGIEAQPVIPTINTVNFNWNRYHQENATAGRPRAGSIPTTTLEEVPENGSQSPSAVH